MSSSDVVVPLQGLYEVSESRNKLSFTCSIPAGLELSKNFYLHDSDYVIEMEYITVEEVKGCESSTWEVKAYPANGEKDKEKDKGSYVLFEKDTEEEAEKNRNSLFTNIPLGEIA